MAAEPEVLDFHRVDFGRIHDRLGRIETCLGEIVLRFSAVERDLAARKVDYACATQLRARQHGPQIERLDRQPELIEA